MKTILTHEIVEFGESGFYTQESLVVRCATSPTFATTHLAAAFPAST